MPTSSFTPVLPPYTRFLPVHPSSLVSVGACSIAGGSLRQGRSLATDSEDNEASGKLFHQKTDKDSGPLGGARVCGVWWQQRINVGRQGKEWSSETHHHHHHHQYSSFFSFLPSLVMVHDKWSYNVCACASLIYMLSRLHFLLSLFKCLKVNMSWGGGRPFPRDMARTGRGQRSLFQTYNIISPFFKASIFCPFLVAA